ncbi:unnamed protein product, partial [Porites lobata]
DVTPFEVQALLYHNLHRGLHDSPLLQLDHQLSLEAAEYAKKIANKWIIKHSPIESRPGQSENIFLRCKAFTKGVSAFEAEKECVTIRYCHSFRSYKVQSWKAVYISRRCQIAEKDNNCVNFWCRKYSTVCFWNFDEPLPMSDKGKPFSRLVWRSSQQMGIGRATFPMDNFNCTAVVARYRPYVDTQDYANNVPKGKFIPTGCQYVNKVDNQDFIVPPRPGEACQKIPGFKGQMLQESSVCTLKQLFAIFGASVRKGKQGFSVVL